MPSLEKIALEEKQNQQSLNEKPIKKAEKFLRTFVLGAGIAFKISAWYLGFYKAGHYAINKNYEKAAKYYASGHIPGKIGTGLILLSGASYAEDLIFYMKDWMKKRKGKKQEKGSWS